MKKCRFHSKYNTGLLQAFKQGLTNVLQVSLETVNTGLSWGKEKVTIGFSFFISEYGVCV